MAEVEPAEDGRDSAPPYIAFQTFKTFLGNMKPHKLPTRIDRSLLGNFSGAVQGQLITALRFLGLIDAKGHTRPDRLEPLVQAYGTDQWPGALDRLLRENYSAVFGIDLAAASPAQFNERYRNAFQGGEQVQRKSMTFFLNAAREAQIEISPHISKNKKPRAVGTPGRRRAPRPAGAKTSTPAPPVVEQPPIKTATALVSDGIAPKAPTSFELLAAFDPSDMSEDEQKAVWTLLQYLRRKETARSSEQRRQKPTKTPAAAAATTETKEATMEPP